MTLNQNLEKNSTNDCINKVTQSGNLIDLSSNLKDLLQLIRCSNSKSKILNQLLRDIREYVHINVLENWLYSPDEPTHFIYDEDRSAVMYLNLRWQKCSNVKDNILALESIIDIINKEITPPQGTIISNDSIDGIMAYINKEFDYSKKILVNKPITVLRLPHSDKRWNACCTTVLTNNDKTEAVISLYHGCTDSKYSTEYVFFHELGHVLQLIVTGTCKTVPESFLQIASPIFPGLDTEYLEHAPEFFADCFAMGAMLDSPFSSLCPFGMIEQAHKYLFKLYMEALIDTL